MKSVIFATVLLCFSSCSYCGRNDRSFDKARFLEKKKEDRAHIITPRKSFAGHKENKRALVKALQKRLPSIAFECSFSLDISIPKNTEFTEKLAHTILMNQREDLLKSALVRGLDVNYLNGRKRSPLANFILSRFLCRNTFRQHILTEKEVVILSAFKRMGAEIKCSLGRDPSVVNWVCCQITDLKCRDLLGLKTVVQKHKK